MKRIAISIMLCAPLLASAQSWPGARPITLIVPFTPGGNVDFAGRVLATRLQERLKQNVIVENVAGAGGIVGVQRAVQATPDGYTLLIGVDSPISIARFVTPSAVRYDPQRDLAPIGILNAAPMIIVGRPGLPANDFGELLRLARTQPGKLSYGTSGVGTVLHLAMERVKILAGIDILHVPYKGGAPIVTDLIGNQVDLAMLVTVATLPQVKSGKIKAFAVTTPQRVPRNVAIVGLLVYALTMTLAAVDWIMSLSADWYSTSLGLLTIVGQSLSGFAFAVVFAVLGREIRRGAPHAGATAHVDRRRHPELRHRAFVEPAARTVARIEHRAGDLVCPA